jgi:tetratricopeptide (TPR) repeat protein
MASLYTMWDQAEPGKGYDAKAGKWYRKLMATFVPVVKAPALVIRSYDRPGDRPSPEELSRFRGEPAGQTQSQLTSAAEAREIVNQADILLHQGRPLAAAALLDTISSEMRPGRDSAGVLRTLGDWYAYQRGDWTQAAARFRMLVRHDVFEPSDVVALDYHRLAALLVELGDTHGYEQMRQELIARLGETVGPVPAERIIRACSLLAADQKTIDSLVRLKEVADDFPNPWAYTSFAILDYRRGKFESAEDWCRQSLAGGPYFGDVERKATTRVVLAMALQQLGKKDKARSNYEDARKVIDAEFSKGFGSYVWFDWLTARNLLREADAQFEPMVAGEAVEKQTISSSDPTLIPEP